MCAYLNRTGQGRDGGEGGEGGGGEGHRGQEGAGRVTPKKLMM